MPKRTSQQASERTGRAGRRLDVLRMLREVQAPLAIVDIAGRLGVHPNTVRFHLDTLMESGQVERAEVDRRATGRPPQLFQVVRGMDPTGPRDYRLLAEVLAHSLATDPDPSTRALDAGRAWGRRRGSVADDASGTRTREPVSRLVGLLEELGFAPERRDNDGRAQIGLRHCPFLELASDRSEIVCPVHLGLMQGAMDAWQSPATVDRLDPFVEPDLCLAHVAVAGAPDGPVHPRRGRLPGTRLGREEGTQHHQGEAE